MKDSTKTARPTKLRNGDWGARVEGTVRKGDTITITTKSGKSWDATVTRVIWTDSGVSIVSTASTSKSKSDYVPAVRNSRGYVTDRGHYDGYCGYPCPVSGKKCCPEHGPCHDCA